MADNNTIFMMFEDGRRADLLVMAYNGSKHNEPSEVYLEPRDWVKLLNEKVTEE